MHVTLTEIDLYVDRPTGLLIKLLAELELRKKCNSP